MECQSPLTTRGNTSDWTREFVWAHKLPWLCPTFWDVHHPSCPWRVHQARAKCEYSHYSPCTPLPFKKYRDTPVQHVLAPPKNLTCKPLYFPMEAPLSVYGPQSWSTRPFNLPKTCSSCPLNWDWHFPLRSRSAMVFVGSSYFPCLYGAKLQFLLIFYITLYTWI